MRNRSNKPESPDLTDCEVVVGLCGGIAAYKTCEVVSSLVQRGAGVTVAMTKAARKFVGPTTFQALTGRRVLTSLWHAHDAADVQHVALTGSADLVLLAPATANIIGKIASGVADDLVSTLVICAASPVVLAPAMNERMWNNPIVQRNVETLAKHGYQFVGPGEGWLACKTVGAGRMAEPAEILDAVGSLLQAAAAKRLAKAE
jgi:phosphopantothenoylcysteine decarboxylase/phosphopantothenate--cysteine ligase